MSIVSLKLKQKTEKLLGYIDSAYINCCVALIYHNCHKNGEDIELKDAEEIFKENPRIFAEDQPSRYDLHLGWIIEGLDEMREILLSIDYQKLSIHIKAKENTSPIFDEKLNKVAKLINENTSGILVCCTEIFSPSSNYSNEVLGLVAETKIIALVIDRNVKILSIPAVRVLLFSSTYWVLIFTFISLVFLSYLYNIYDSQSSPNFVVTMFGDFENIADIYNRNEGGILEKIYEVATYLIGITNVIPYFFLLVSIVLFVFRTVLTSDSRQKKKLKKLEKYFKNLSKEMIQQKSIVKEIVMGDKYESKGQVAAMGKDAHAHDITFNQVWNQNKSIDIKALEADLSSLREELQKIASKAEDYAELGAVAAAEVEARNGNGPKALEALSKAGGWSLSVAEKIGAGVVTAAIKNVCGL